MMFRCPRRASEVRSGAYAESLLLAKIHHLFILNPLPLLMQKLHAFLSGRVQGVFFRYMTKRYADARGITGWIKNLDDGCVEVIAQGDETALKEFLAYLRIGPPIARVDGVDYTLTEGTETFKSFEIKY